MKSIHLIGAILTGTLALSAAPLAIDDVSAHGTAPGEAEVSARVTGAGTVYAEYAHADASYRSVKDRYVQNGLVAMWDAVDNMGTGAHVADATTWRDLMGNHPDMTFTAAPTIGATSYDLSKGGCGVPAPEIAQFIDAGSATVEIVCKVRSIVNDSTLFACVDGTDTTTKSAGNRIVWARHQNNGSGTGVLGAIEYRRNAYYRSCLVDKKVDEMRSFVFLFSKTDGCVAVTNGVWAYAEPAGPIAGNTANGWFSLGQRICKAGTSAAISDMQVCSVRVYDHYLTNAERLANYAVDRERFFDGTAAVDLDAAAGERICLGTVSEPVTSAKDFYATDGLIAMWDGEDNQGTGAHVADATTWVDLTGKHAAMQFETAPTVAATYYDISKGGGCIKSCADIAQALQAKNATIEIVCDVRSIVESATLVSVVDGAAADGGAGNRLLWVMHGALGSNHQGVLGTIDYLTDSSSTPYPSYDTTLASIRSYTLDFATDACRVYRNGASTDGTSKAIGKNGAVTLGNAATACFSIGQRFSQTGKSVAISDMRVYCVRVYNRRLSAAEVVANHAMDVTRFFGAKNGSPVGSLTVTNADGTKTTCTDGRAHFRLTGLRADVVPYTVRLTSEDGSVKSADVVMETASERTGSAWYTFLDTRTVGDDSQRAGNAQYIDLGYAPTGHVPAVEAKYQILGGDGHGVFGAIDNVRGTYVMQLEQDGVSKFRYRLDESNGGYAALSSDVLTGVQELVFNGPNGTFLNGQLLDAELAGLADPGTLGWILFGRNIDSTGKYKETGKVRVWNFRLFSDGELIRDLVPACGPDGKACCYDRLSDSFYQNRGYLQFCHGSELPGLSLQDPVVVSGRLTAKLTRTGTAASDVWVVSGDRHGGARLAGWAHAEKLSEGFAEGASSLSVEVNSSISKARYARFLSVADGWSDSTFAPELKQRKGLMLIVK